MSDLYGDSKVISIFYSGDEKLDPHLHLIMTREKESVGE
jgi:hypothetical protein